MAKQNIPYLCGGTFLAQVLRARKDLTTAEEHRNEIKESLSEQETFRRLISIYQLADFHGGTSLKPYTSQFKGCSNSLTSYTMFSDNDRRRTFDEDVKAVDSTALRMMAEFVSAFLNPSLWLQLVRCILDVIQNDSDIQDDDLFYITADGIATTAKDLQQTDYFCIEPFLLGVWHYIIMYRADYNEKGADTYTQWYPSKNNYRGTVGNEITRSISVTSMPPIAKSESHDENTSNSEGKPRIEVIDSDSDAQDKSGTYTQYIEHATIVNQNGEKNIHIDHVDTLNL